MKKKRIWIILACVVLLLAVVITAVVLSHKKYLKKLRYDDVESRSYNGVRIVTEDGLCYLEKNGKKVGDGYLSLVSVNDYYRNIESLLADPDSGVVLFDYYLARRADLPNYLLVNSAGEELMLMGDNYVLEKVVLPYLIFVNNTTSRRAAVSLLRIDSDLSAKSGTELTMKPFTSIEAEKYQDDSVLYDCVFTTDSLADSRYSVYRNDGIRLFSSESYEKKIFTDSLEKTAVYYIDREHKTVYSSTGDKIASEVWNTSEENEKWLGVCGKTEESGERYLVAVSAYRKLTLPESKYRIEDMLSLEGALLVPTSDGSQYEFFSMTSEKSVVCREMPEVREKLIHMMPKNGDNHQYWSLSGEQLMESEYADMSCLDHSRFCNGECHVLTSTQYNEAHDGKRYLHFAMAGKKAVSLEFGEEDPMPLINVEGAVIDGTGFLIHEVGENGKDVYRLCTPFSLKPIGNPYDKADFYTQGGVVWALCASYERKCYEIVDPMNGNVAGSIDCTEEDFAKLAFSYVTGNYLAPDAYDADCAVPVSIIQLTKYEDNDGVTSQTRYFALYRAAAQSDSLYSYRTLMFSEIGRNLRMEKPVTFYPEKNTLVLNQSASSIVLHMDRDDTLKQYLQIPMRISGILEDKADPSVRYYITLGDNGKYGVYDEEGTQLLAPVYDKILGVSDRCFAVSLGGACGVMEYKGSKARKLIEFRYISIKVLSDNGYLAVDGNENTFLYEGKKVIFDDPIQSYTRLTDYSMTDDGKAVRREEELFHMEGKLYLHASDKEIRIRCQDFDVETSPYSRIQNHRAKVVYYYEKNKVVHTDVIYPVSSDRSKYVLQPSEGDSGWYFEKTASGQTVVVNSSDILDSSDYIIRLYPKASEE